MVATVSKLHYASTSVTTLPSSLSSSLYETAHGGILWTISTVVRWAFANGADPEATNWAHRCITVYVARWNEYRTGRPCAIYSIDRGEFNGLLFKVLDEIARKEDIGSRQWNGLFTATRWK